MPNAPSPRQKLVVYAVAALSGSIGVCSLALFGGFLWTGGFGLLQLNVGNAASLIWDGLLCLIFFLQHSTMIRQSFRRRVSLTVPTPWYGVVYTLASSAALLLLVGCWQRTDIVLAAARGAGAGLIRCAFLAAMAGVLWGIIALPHFDPFGTGALTAHMCGEQPHPPTLTIAGPYCWMRHPVYSFGVVAICASPVLTADRFVFDALFTLWIIVGAALEERDLSTEFGAPYDRYRMRVPMLVPWPAGFRRSRYSAPAPSSDAVAGPSHGRSGNRPGASRDG